VVSSVEGAPPGSVDQALTESASTRGDRVRDESAEAEAEWIGLGDTEMVEQRDDVICERLDRHRAVGVAVGPWLWNSTAITCLLATF